MLGTITMLRVREKAAGDAFGFPCAAEQSVNA
jgi:hypothetical protein